MNSTHPLILWETNQVVGQEFLKDYHRARSNTKILAMFLAVLLHMGVSKEISKKLTQMVFVHALLGDIDATLDNVDDNRKIPMPHNYYMMQMRGREVMKFPLV